MAFRDPLKDEVNAIEKTKRSILPRDVESPSLCDAIYTLRVAISSVSGWDLLEMTEVERKNPGRGRSNKPVVGRIDPTGYRSTPRLFIPITLLGTAILLRHADGDSGLDNAIIIQEAGAVSIFRWLYCDAFQE